MQLGADSRAVRHPAPVTLAHKLAALRLRHRLRLYAIALLVGLAVALAILLLGRIEGPSALGWPQALLAGLLALLVGAAIAHFRTPSAKALAREVETRLQLSERLSTALEVSAGPAPGIVGAALIADADRQAERIEPRQLAPLFPPPLVASLLAVLGLGTAVLLVPAYDGRTAPQAALVAAGSAEPEIPATDAQEIARLAELVRADAEMRRDPFLEAVANSLDDLAQDLQSARADADVNETLAELLDYARAAYGVRQPGWLPQAGAEAGQLRTQLAAYEREQAARAANRSDFVADGESFDPDAFVPLPDEWDPSALDPTRRGPEALAERVQAMGQGVATDATLVDSGLRSAAASLPVLDESEPKRMSEQEIVGGTPIGGAQQSGRGASEFAGEGSQPLGPDAGAAGMELAMGGELALTSGQPGGGNRIRIQMDPQASFTPDAGGAVGGAAWEARAEQVAAQRSYVPAESRQLVARYFAREPLPGTVD